MIVPTGYVALILHAHLPYVRWTGTDELLEERWLFEALSESYLPLYLALAAAPGKVALSLSPPLIAMLDDPAIMERYRLHLLRTLTLCDQEHAWEPELATYYRKHYGRLLLTMDDLQWQPLRAFRQLAEWHKVELLTTAATHGYLPLVSTEAGRRLQIEAGIAGFTAALGRRPAGFWLPECGYEPGLDHLLASAGIAWTVLEQETATGAIPAPPGLPHSPIRTPGGVACFPRDREVALQVWASGTGYPGDSVYREFYKDIGYDRPYGYIQPYIVDGRVRYDTGLKYHRITAPGIDLAFKQRYDPAVALDRARQHAAHFAALLLARCQAATVPDPVITLPFDAELFGHWWWEGPAFLGALLPLLQQAGLATITPSDYLAMRPDLPGARIPAGSWGAGGDSRVWLDPANDWVYPPLARMEETVVHLAAADDPRAPAAARELLLAQSSDWAFMLSQKASPDYARRRVMDHTARFFGLAAPAGAAATAEVAATSEATAATVIPLRPAGAPTGGAPGPTFFPHLSLAPLAERRPLKSGPLRVLHLSWEYPPDLTGGLGRHVHDLAHALADHGDEIHVLTLGQSFATEPGAVTVHTVPPGARTPAFLDWVYRFNHRMIDAALRIGPFDVIHAHDWLVGQAAQQLALRWGAPLVATIHALERGRQGAIRDDLQQAVHLEEFELVQKADRVITVSHAMAADINGLFKREQVIAMRNGISPPPLPHVSREPDLLFFAGRLVHEKGADLLLEAMIRMRRPTRAIIAGRGPALTHLQQLTRRLGLAGRVSFPGFISDEEKFRLFATCAAAVIPSRYEPFGIVALEAMAMAAPTAVSRTGGLAEIVQHGVDGLLIPPDDPAAWAGALDWLLANPSEGARLGAGARQRVLSHFTWEEVAQQTRSIYRSIG